MAYEQSSLAKISDAQKIIKNKFIKAYSIRVDHENDVNEALKPLSSINRTSTKKTKQIAISNKLCVRLQKLLDSQTSRNADYRHVIEMIIAKLRELEIIA